MSKPQPYKSVGLGSCPSDTTDGKNLSSLEFSVPWLLNINPFNINQVLNKLSINAAPITETGAAYYLLVTYY